MQSRSVFSNHDSHTISTFDVIGSYFVDTIFNHIYSNANVNLGKNSSLTDEYIRRIQAYVLGVKNDSRCYDDMIQNIHKYYMRTTRFTTLSFGEFVDKIVGICIPSEYFQQCTPQQKDEILSTIICDLLSNLAVYATQPAILNKIVDNHMVAPDVTVRLLQDTSVGFLINMKTTLSNKFLQKESQARENVSTDTLEDMKKILRKLVREKADLIAKLKDAEDEMREMNRNSKHREAKLLKMIDMLKRANTEGAASVGSSLTLPRRETIAESTTFNDNVRALPPKRDTIAEAAASHGAPKQASTVSANFFKTMTVPHPTIVTNVSHAVARPSNDRTRSKAPMVSQPQLTLQSPQVPTRDDSDSHRSQHATLQTSQQAQQTQQQPSLIEQSVQAIQQQAAPISSENNRRDIIDALLSGDFDDISD